MRSFRYMGFALAVAMLACSVQAGTFDIVFQVKTPKGVCQVRTPGATEFVPAIRNKAYPYGTSVQTVGPESSIVLLITGRDALRLMSDTKVTVNKEKTDISTNAAKVVKLSEGTLLTRLSSSSTNYPVFIDSAVGRCEEMFGNCKMTFRKGTNDASLIVRAEANSQLKFIAPQVVVPVLRNGYGFSIKTLDDQSFTRINNLFGDYPIFINTGLEVNPTIAEGDENESEFLFPIKSSSKSKINLWRENAPVGNKLIVSVLATDSEGKGTQSFAFAVGEPSITSRSQVPTGPSDSEEEDEEEATATEGTDDSFAAFAEEPVEETTSDSTGEDDFSDFESSGSLDEFLF